MAQLFLNNCYATLAQPITATDTQIQVSGMSGFPSVLAADEYFLMTVYADTTRYGENIEVVKVTGLAGTTLTVERGYEGEPVPHAINERAEARLTAKTLRRVDGSAPGPLEQVCKYYGYPVSINGAWNTNEAAVIYARYDVVVWGDAYHDPLHESYADTVAVATRLLQLNPNVKLFGYVPIGMDPAWNDSSLPMTEIKARIDNWKAIGATHIFLDEFGYDYYITRERQNEAVQYCHDQGLWVCANGWDVDHLFSNQNIVLDYIQDAQGNNWQGNPNLLPSLLTDQDYVQFENMLYSYDHPPGTDSVANPPQLVRNDGRIWDMLTYTQVGQAEFGGQSYYEVYGTKGYALDAIMERNPRMYNEGYLTALACKMHAYCASIGYWGAVDSNYHHYTAPKLPIENVDEVGTTRIADYLGLVSKRFTTPIGNASEIDIIWTQEAGTRLFVAPPVIANEGQPHILRLTLNQDVLVAGGGISFTLGDSTNPALNPWIDLALGDTAQTVREKVRDYPYSPEVQAIWNITIDGTDIVFTSKVNQPIAGTEWWVYHPAGVFDPAITDWTSIQVGSAGDGAYPIYQVTLDGHVLYGDQGEWWRRPVGAEEGTQYFDTTVNQPLWFRGGKWVAADGSEVGFEPTATLVEKLDAANYTANDVLAKLLTVDGAGSGLDADTLDGQQASAFASTGHTHDTRYYTKAEVDTQIGDIGTILDTINGEVV